MTQDLTKITTPFGLLDAETQDALRQAYSDNTGVQMQIYTSRGWADMVVSPEWYGSFTYRIKPEPEVVSMWASIYTQYIGLFESSREMADKNSTLHKDRICVLRIDWCDGDVTFHKEEI
jgi:hypothetical protein